MQADKSARLVCPDCRSHLQRVSRSFLDRLLGLLVSSRRYRCVRCGWGGLLQGRARRHGAYQSYRPLDAAREAPRMPGPRRNER
jgi:DNA-directed RNA polymerase subunit RPC12/RpoP